MRILTGTAAEANPFVMPTNSQLEKLFAIVIRKYPVLEPSHRDGWTERQRELRAVAFRNAFHAVAYLGRRAAPETKNVHALSYWRDKCEEWLHGENLDGDIGLGVLTIAILSHGDIPYLPLDRWPLDLAFGLTLGGRRGTDQWKRVLDSGQLLPPSPVARSQNYATPPVSIKVLT